MIRTIIVDDEKHCIISLTQLLQRNHAADIQVLAAFSNIEDAFAGIKNMQPDLLFLDIEINGKTVFELLQQLGNLNFNVVFTTAHEKYAIQAFKFSAINYLLKPIDPDDLEETIKRVKKDLLKHEFPMKYDMFLEELKSNIAKTRTGDAKRMSIPTARGIAIEDIDNIIRCESQNKNIIIYLKDKKTYTISTVTLNKYEDLLGEHKFYRVHDSHLINVKHIKEYLKEDECVIMTDGSKVYISDRKRKAFKNYLSGLI